AHYPTAIQVQHGSQVIPSTLRPDVRDIAAPNRIRRCNSELALKVVGNVGPFNSGALVRMGTRLLTDQTLLLHQASDLEAAHFDALIPEHGNDTAAAS